MLGSVNVPEAAFSQNLPQFELFEEGQLLLLVEDFGSFGFLNADVSICGS